MYQTLLQIAPQLVEPDHTVDGYNQKLSSVKSKLSSVKSKLSSVKQYQLKMLNEMKNNEIEIANNRYQHQIQQLDQQRNEQMSSFKKYCIKELEKIKKEIQRTNEPNDINFNEIYSKWHRKHIFDSNPRINRSLRTRSTSKLICFPPKASLEYDEIVSDLTVLFNKAKEKGIEVPDDLIPIKRPKQRVYKYKVGVLVNQDDRNEIDNICNKIGIDITDRQLSVALYGFQSHLDVYQTIFGWINENDVRQQTDCINQLKSGKLRDLQVKLASTGTVGRKNEMGNGIRIKLKQLTYKYNAK